MLNMPRRRGPKPGKIKPVKPKLFSSKVKGPRPLIWCTGPDPVRHRMYIAYGRAKAQADFRREPWELTFEQYEKIWQGRWHLRGRTIDTLCLGRIDYNGPWSVNNTIIRTRREHNLAQVAWRQAQI